MNPYHAIAYLKADVSSDDGPPAMELPHEDSPVLTDIGNNLLISYVVDSADAFTYIQNRHIAAAGISEAQLQEVGLTNLAGVARSGSLRVAPHPTNEIFAVLLDGNFEASLILLDSLWDVSFRQFVQGDYVAAIPTRDVLAFCDSRSEVGRQELQEIIDKLRTTNDHPLLHELIIRRNDKWVLEEAA